MRIRENILVMVIDRIGHAHGCTRWDRVLDLSSLEFATVEEVLIRSNPG